ncbi:hypothetical protein ZIOFF_006885 [Zingiber officinale]|uniref:Uncharacterized protein n=1 Tax=Zingiber officinale TaxID=94328 RepID=A0A8J5ICP6_ZINOF|nr:hypothetical protein ZIOFF_006885 [Zingiber officinale]
MEESSASAMPSTEEGLYSSTLLDSERFLPKKKKSNEEAELVWNFIKGSLEKKKGQRTSSVESSAFIATYARDLLLRSLVSLETDANPKTKEIAKKIMIVGLWCIQIKPENRPSISMVINMLEGSIMDLQMPPKPEFS